MTENQAVTGGITAGGLRRGAAVAYRWLLLVFVVAGAAQIFMAGLGFFHHHSVGLGPHKALGFTMGGIAVVIAVLALIARPGGRAVIGSVVLVVQTDLLQSLLGSLGDDAAFWGGLHALDGLLAIAVAWYLFTGYGQAGGRLGTGVGRDG